MLKLLNQYKLSLNGKTEATNNSLKYLNTETLQKIYSSIIRTKNLVNIGHITGFDLPNEIDLLTYSFPCQDLSNVGALHGYKSGIDRNAQTRSGLLWQVERILNERQKADLDLPKYLLLENVTALANPRNIENFDEWRNNLNKLGYINKTYQLNAKDFGLPQNRDRIIMLSILCDDDEKIEQIEEYFENNNLEDSQYRNQLNINKLNLLDCVRTKYKNKKYLEEALECQPNKTVSRDKIWEDNYKIIDENGKQGVKVVRTITTKQDRHPNSGNLYFNPKNNRSRWRYLTPRECFILMGFFEEDFDKIKSNNFLAKGSNSYFFTRDNLIKMAGNSIAVNVLMQVFQQVKDIECDIFDNRIGFDE